jgi:hypothetical protein
MEDSRSRRELERIADKLLKAYDALDKWERLKKEGKYGKSSTKGQHLTSKTKPTDKK